MKPAMQVLLERIVGEVFQDEIAPILPDGVGCTLLVFDLGASGFMAYASNAQRADMIEALRECALNLEANQRNPNPSAEGGR